MRKPSHDCSNGPAAMGRREFTLLLMAGAAGPVEREIARTESRLGPGLDLSRSWNNGVCSFRLKNRGAEPSTPREVILFDWRHSLPAGTAMYGEGFQMLSQTGGTLATPRALGGYEDAVHYRIPKPADAHTVYNLLLLTPASGHHILLAFTSARRFTGRFHIRPGSIQVACDLEQLTLAPGESWDLEDFVVLEGRDRAALLHRLAGLLRANHPIQLPATPPRGWCSWVAFADRVNAEGVLAAARDIRDRAPWLRFIQIDGGYMRHLGDWMQPSATFGGSVRDTLLRVRDLGREPALWLAPFIAERQSELFARHPGWFVRDDAGAPLAANRVTFGGWKNPPWFALDGTHPEVQEFLETLLRTLNRDWGSTYFKLDANFWGAMHGGRFHDPKATRIEAYRRGMQAILRGAGSSFILGCNHPMWPSLGVVHGSRSSNDIAMNWVSVRNTSVENLSRLWQNGRLWWNDPDTVQFSGHLTAGELEYHLDLIHAARGLVMSSDNFPKLTAQQIARLEKIATAPPGLPEFDAALTTGADDVNHLRYLFNATDSESRRSLPAGKRWHDFWSGELLTASSLELPPYSARILRSK